jgi:hypothetical protein
MFKMALSLLEMGPVERKPVWAGMGMRITQCASGLEPQLLMGCRQGMKFPRGGLQSFEMEQKNSCPFSTISGTHIYGHLHPLPKP